MIDKLIKKLEAKVNWMRLEFSGFPFMCCKLARLALYDDFGFLIVKGEYYGPFDKEYRQARAAWGDLSEDFVKVPHDFSYDPELRLFIDITARQFHKSNPKVVAMSEDDPRVALKWDDINQSTTHHVLQMYVLKNMGGYKLPCIAPRELKPKGMID
ncbi:hypothetical protein HYU07_03945 [Candidatus Woesearchaeota archaeon]|nr:hypothetical protein [Candidatus Woesearchaeota archaeon]